MTVSGHRGGERHSAKGGTDPDAERRYALADAKAGERALEVLSEKLRLEVTPRSRVARTYYDTFDRRLGAERTLLYRSVADGEISLRWESLAGRLLRRLATRKEPGLATDLPAGPFRDAIAPLLDVRRLLPIARLKGHTQAAAVLDTRGKTIVRLSLEQFSVVPEDQPKRKRPLTLLRVTPVKGYAEPAAEVAAVLETELGHEPVSADTLQGLLGLLETPRKSGTGPLLERGMRSDEAVKRVYAHLLEVIVANEEGTRARTDPEFLHQFRVAIRRTRAGLARLRGLFPERTNERFKREFAWLGSITSPMRDLDVHLLELPDYAASLPEDARAHLEPLREHLEAEADAEQARLVKGLASVRYRRLIESWRTWLARPAPQRTLRPDAMRPVEDLARERIWKLHRRILKRGRKITDDTPAEAVHELRLDAKKLRYLMEFFRELFDAKAMKEQIRALKQLQEVLGRFNDFEVQQAALEAAATSMAAEDAAPLETVVVMGRLIETSRRNQDAARAEIRGRIATFAEPVNRARAAALFAPGPEVRSA